MRTAGIQTACAAKILMDLHESQSPGTLNPTPTSSVLSSAGAETPGHVSASPHKPSVLIEPSDASSVSLELREVWKYRELLYFLTWRDIKLRYKQTALGATWAIIQPLFTMLLFTLFFGRLAGVPSDGVPYPLFAYAGLVLWTFFSNAITNSGNSLVGSTTLITKVYFPRVIIPAAAVGAGLMDLGIASIILFVMLVYYDMPLTANLLMLPVIVVLATLLATGVGMWTSALNVKFRDVRYALPFAIQLWLFASPVIYPSSIVPGRWRWVLALNPMTGIIEGFRAALFGRSFNWLELGFAAILTALVIAYAAYTFRRVEDTFADIV